VFLTFGLTLTYSASIQNENGHRIVRRDLAPIDGFGMYLAEWTANLDTRSISFHVVVETLGYVGFGFSPNGMMVGADIAIGGVNDDGWSFYFGDRHGTGYNEPPLDESQDYTLNLVVQNDTHTTLGFSRLLNTGDAVNDFEIKDEETTIIWAFGSTDSIEYHRGTRGQYTTNLLQA